MAHSPYNIFYGRMERATYRDQVIPLYQNNPLIEALPDILTEDDFLKQATVLPAYDESHRQLPPEIKLHLVLTASQCFQPLPVHIDLERRFSRILRTGLQHRNPLEYRFWKTVDEVADAVATNSIITHRTVRSLMLGFTILGMSGVGKTAAIETVLSLYPQVVFHTEYGAKKFTWVQVVWLKLECPHDSSIKALCLSFFASLDSLLDTNYYLNYARNGRATVDEMMLHMARLSFIHSIGCLVIDEIQRLSEAKSGGSTRMLNFFVQLVNTVGMPVIQIGTPKARAILSSEFSQVRRGAGQGDFVWNVMEQDDIWNVFLETIWTYQYTTEPTPLTPELSQAIYYESAGIADLAVKLYVLSQVRAIERDDPQITPDTVASVARDSFSTARAMLSAIRRKDYQALDQFDDIQFIDIETEIQQSMLRVQQSVAIRPLETEDTPDSEPINGPRDTQEATTPPPIPSKVQRAPRIPKGGLPEILSRVLKDKTNPYQAFQAAGFIRSASDYIP